MFKENHNDAVNLLFFPIYVKCVCVASFADEYFYLKKLEISIFISEGHKKLYFWTLKCLFKIICVHKVTNWGDLTPQTLLECFFRLK